jgi:hypothetical protein
MRKSTLLLITLLQIPMAGCGEDEVASLRSKPDENPLIIREVNHSIRANTLTDLKLSLSMIQVPANASAKSFSIRLRKLRRPHNMLGGNVEVYREGEEVIEVSLFNTATGNILAAADLNEELIIQQTISKFQEDPIFIYSTPTTRSKSTDSSASYEDALIYVTRAAELDISSDQDGSRVVTTVLTETEFLFTIAPDSIVPE